MTKFFVTFMQLCVALLFGSIVAFISTGCIVGVWYLLTMGHLPS